MFNCLSGTNLHAVWPNCDSYVGELGMSLVNKKQNQSIQGLSYKNAVYIREANNSAIFFTFNMEKNIKDLIEKNIVYYDEMMSDKSRDKNVIKDIYDGKNYWELKKI